MVISGSPGSLQQGAAQRSSIWVSLHRNGLCIVPLRRTSRLSAFQMLKITSHMGIYHTTTQAGAWGEGDATIDHAVRTWTGFDGVPA